MEENKSESKKYFDEQASYYDEQDTIEVSKLPRTSWPLVIDEVKELEATSLLDVGCGTGELLRLLREQNETIALAGLDLSSEMVKKAQSKNIKDCTIVEGDSEFLPFDSDKFDVLTCVLSFHHFPKPKNCLKEFNRVLRPDGCLLISEVKSAFLTRLFGNKALNPYVLSSGDYKLYTPKKLQTLMEDAGFKNVSVIKKGELFFVKGYK